MSLQSLPQKAPRKPQKKRKGLIKNSKGLPKSDLTLSLKPPKRPLFPILPSLLPLPPFERPCVEISSSWNDENAVGVSPFKHTPPSHTCSVRGGLFLYGGTPSFDASRVEEGTNPCESDGGISPDRKLSKGGCFPTNDSPVEGNPDSLLCAHPPPELAVPLPFCMSRSGNVISIPWSRTLRIWSRVTMRFCACKS